MDWASCAAAFVNDDARGFERRRDVVGLSNLSDACDAGAFEARDSDGDGITDVPNLCPYNADPDQSDADGDQAGDVCDLCDGDDATGDADGDLVCDDLDVCADFDDWLDTLISGQRDDSLDVGLEPAVIGNRVWDDRNADGRRQPGEPGQAGITVRLLDESGAEVTSAVTDSDGVYQFRGVGSGRYRIEVLLPPDGVFSIQDVGANAFAAGDRQSPLGRWSA